MTTLSNVIDSQIYLFGQYGIERHHKEALRYIKLKDIPNFKTLFHEARTATYCKDEQPNFFSDACIKQALDNFEIGKNYLLNKSIQSTTFPNLNFTLKPNNEKMPEALWYCPIGNDKPAARIGLNFHYENENIVATIANIQGKSAEDLSQLKISITPKVWSLEAVNALIYGLNPKIKIIRGIPSAQHPSSSREGFDKHRASCLYDWTFRNAQMIPIRSLNKTVKYYEIHR